MSNGVRSTQFEKIPTKYTHMIPRDIISKIRAVILHHYHNSIYGFSFLDNEGEVMWKHGWTTWSEQKQDTVEIKEDERIVGIRATLTQSKWFGLH